MSTIKSLVFFLLGMLVSQSAVSQYITRVSALDQAVQETSGLLWLDQRLITHNDSGGEAALYEIDPLTGGISRKVILRNALNRDWEAICCDSTYIYIGDFGNNFGNRKDLGIYRLLIADYLTTETDSVDAERINFSYADQEDFEPNPGYTNYDAEAVIACNDSLYIFTKNWGDGWCDIYSCPAEPGSYLLRSVDAIHAKGLVTGATYNPESGTILFCGYAFFFPFLMELSDFSSNNFSGGTLRRYFLPLEGSAQIEGITGVPAHRYFFSSEGNRKGVATLYDFQAIDLTKMKQREKQPGPSILIKFLSILKDNWLFRLLFRYAQ